MKRAKKNRTKKSRTKNKKTSKRYLKKAGTGTKRPLSRTSSEHVFRMNSLNDVKQKLFHDTEDEKPPIPPQILPLTIIIPKTPDDSVKQIESPFSGSSNVVVDLDNIWFDNYYKFTIGKGGFGSVHAVQKDEKTYAVKVVNIKFEDKRKMADNEIKILRLLESSCAKYILCYVGHFFKKPFAYIVCEYLENYMELLTYIESKMKEIGSDEYISQYRVAKYEIICNLCEGLNAIHNLGIAHRDIKPENIMVSPTDFSIKYIDFGLSYAETDDYKTMPELKNRSFGTANYVDPDVGKLLKKNRIDFETLKKADVYSLGITIYELISGRSICRSCIEHITKGTPLAKYDAREMKFFYDIIQFSDEYIVRKDLNGNVVGLFGGLRKMWHDRTL